MKNVSIVIPLFNEEGVVDELIKRLKHAVNGLNYSFEFIIVDDGSNDKTLEKLLVCKNSEHRLKILATSFLDYNLDDIYMIPALRAFIEKNRSLAL